MKKLKVLSALGLLGLSTLALVGCNDDEKTTTTTAGTTTTTTTVDNSAEIAASVLAYAKTDAIKDIDSYKESAVSLTGMTTEDLTTYGITTAYETAKTAINASTTTEAIDSACSVFYAAIATSVENYRAAVNLAITTAIANAKNEIDELARNGFYVNTTDDGSIESLRVYSASTFDKASSVEELATMLTEAKVAINNAFDILLENSYVKITTYQELLAMESNKNYALANDIDFSEYVVTTGSTLQNYKGIFNGKGYTIKNFNIVGATANKCGLLFQSILEGAVIENVRFMNCSHTGNQEGIALITGQATKGVFRNIEFYGCTVDAGSKSYAGLLIGRKTIEGVTVDQITVKGNSYTSANYGGGLIGDARDLGNDAVVSFTNLDIDMNMNVTGNTGGLLIGRLDGDKATFIVKNSRIHANITGKSSKASLLFDGATEHTDYTVENLLLSANYGDGITSDMYTGQKYGPVTASNIYYIQDETDAVLKSEVPVAVQSADLNADWYYNVLKLDSNIWITEANGGIKLAGASSNVVDEKAELLSISVYTSRTKTYFYFNDEFNTDNLVVIGKYKNPDGSILEATLSTTEVAALGSYTVSSEGFNNQAAGTYTITVTASKKNPADTNPDDGQDKWEATGSYTVTVNTITDLNVYSQEANVVFLKGEEFDTTGLVVKAIYSSDSTTTDDDVETTMHNSDAKTFYTVDSSAYQKDTVGTYTITVSATENGTNYTGTYTVEVVDKIDVSGLTSVEVTVDSTAAATTVDTAAKTATFKSISSALDYLTALNLDASVRKVIHLKDGTYNEKITVNLPNVTFDGTSEAGTIISYGAASGHKYLDESLGNYGTDNSATVLVKATGFIAKNVTFVNSYDYFAEDGVSDKQALAIGVYADQAVFYNCSFKGFQDTLQTKSGRSYFYECYIEGTVDFIFGVNCTAYFEKCEIKSLNRNSTSNGGYIVAPKTDVAYTYGFYFNDCDFTAGDGVTDGTVSIARPWGASGTCVVINSRLGIHISKVGYSAATSTNSRYEDMSGNKPMNANFKEYGNTGDGAIAEAVEGGSFLTKEEADTITVSNLFKADTTLAFEAWDATQVLNSIK